MAANALIVLAHPGKTSLSRSFADEAMAALTERGESTTLLDLYADGFQPSLTRDERDTYYASSPQVDEAHSALLSQAQTLVLVFPTWWFGMPAILKGWMDRVFAPGIAFEHANNFGPIGPRLTNLKQVLVITTLGSPAWIDWFVLRRPIRRILKIAVFGLCAPQAKLTMLSLYAAEKPEPERVRSFRRRIGAALAGH